LPVSSAPRISYDAALRQALSINSGSTVYIEVRVLGHPRPNITWFRGDTVLHDTARLSIETSEGWSHIKVKAATEEDAGLYRVTAENVVGLDTAEFRVIIKGLSILSSLCHHHFDFVSAISGLEATSMLKVLIQWQQYDACL
jgi:Immunoglobulin I-set domain